MSTSVIVFAKAPVAGLAKTRLAPALGAAGAAALAERMLRHALAQATAADVGPVELCAAPDTTHPALRDAAAACGAALAEQGSGDLGQRMHRAFARHLVRHGRALLIGTDAPALDAALLRQAAQALQQHELVFVPALDGGYALVGQRRADPRWFADMAWSHARVMADTRGRLRAAGVRWAELPPVADIDEPADLARLPAGWLDGLPPALPRAATRAATAGARMKRLVLAGAGHTHALALLDWVRQPLPGVEVVVVSPEPLAPYSGMVPGWLAGVYRYDEIVIDFPALVSCAAAAAGAAGANVRWIEAEVQALDPARRQLGLSDGSTLDYDVLSLNVGSTLHPPAAAHALMLPLRPLARLRRQYAPLLERWRQDSDDRPWVVTAVGGGAAGFEALLAVLQRLRRLRPDRDVEGLLLTRGSVLLPGLATAARRAAQRALDRAGVSVRLASGWCAEVDRGSDVVLWATGAEAHGWQRDPLRRGDLAVDASGFIQIDAQLRSVSHPQVFASGDCASWPGSGLPKAGVHAVRMGPVLADNLRAALAGAVDLRQHRPQRRFLTLLATADGRAIAARGPFGAAGAWAWRWKDRIDRRFVGQFRESRAAGGPRQADRPSTEAVAAAGASPVELPAAGGGERR